MRSLFKKWKWYFIGSLAITSVVSFATITTFDRKEIHAWFTLGVPLSIFLANYLNYLEHKGAKGKISSKTVLRSFVFATILGSILSVFLIGIFELGNAAISEKTKIEKLVLVRKWKTGNRKLVTWNAELVEMKSNRHFEIELNRKEFMNLKVNSVYRLSIRKGLFGWYFKFWDLEYEKI